MKKLFVLLIPVFSSVALLGQISIRGHVFDNFSGMPVGLAQIRVLNSTISVLTEESNGFFSIVDIPQGAVINSTIEILVTKDGYFPETTIQALSNQNVSISIRPKETIVQKWYTRLKSSKNASPAIIMIIGNFAIKYPSSKLEVEDVLLEIQTKYEFDYSIEEQEVAKECLSLINSNQNCDKALENIKSQKEVKRQEELNKIQTQEERDELKKTHLLEDLMYSIRFDKELSSSLANVLVEAFLYKQYLIIREVKDKGLNLEEGDIIIKYEDKEVHSLEDWNNCLRSSINQKNINLQIRKKGVLLKNIIVPSGELNIVLGTAEKDELIWLKEEK